MSLMYEIQLELPAAHWQDLTETYVFGSKQ